METIQLPSVDFDYLNCILWRNPSDFNGRIWFINDNFLMSCQSGDNEYFKKQIQFDDEEEFQFEDKENYMKVDNGNEEFQHDNDKSEDCACRGEGFQPMNDESEDEEVLEYAQTSIVFEN